MPQRGVLVNCGNYPDGRKSPPRRARRQSASNIGCPDVNFTRSNTPFVPARTNRNLPSNTKSGTLSANAVGVLHHKLVSDRRVEVLSGWFARLLPPGAQRVLDVGCGDGLISAVLQQKRPEIAIEGIDVLPRIQTHIPVVSFDGSRFPFPNASFDVVLFSDVLHHTLDPIVLLREACRTATQHILIKDHFRDGMAAQARLRFMDWVGNARFGVSLPYNYWSQEQWRASWKAVSLKPEHLVTRLDLYPKPADWIFGAKLHFIGLLSRV